MGKSTKKLGIGLALVVVLAPTAAEAAEKGSCETTADVGSKIWKVAGPTVKQALGKAGPHGVAAAKAAQLIEQGIKFWNSLAGDKTWAKIGPRRLDFGEWNKGTLIGPTERMFVSSIPAPNPVTVRFEKLDFKGKVKIVVCKVPERGKPVQVKAFTVDDSTKKGHVETIAVPGAMGNVITVVLHGKSVANKLQYRVKARLDQDDEQPAPTRRVTGEREPKEPEH